MRSFNVLFSLVAFSAVCVTSAPLDVTDRATQGISQHVSRDLLLSKKSPPVENPTSNKQSPPVQDPASNKKRPSVKRPVPNKNTSPSTDSVSKEGKPLTQKQADEIVPNVYKETPDTPDWQAVTAAEKKSSNKPAKGTTKAPVKAPAKAPASTPAKVSVGKVRRSGRYPPAAAPAPIPHDVAPAPPPYTRSLSLASQAMRRAGVSIYEDRAHMLRLKTTNDMWSHDILVIGFQFMNSNGELDFRAISTELVWADQIGSETNPYRQSNGYSCGHKTRQRYSLSQAFDGFSDRNPTLVYEGAASPDYMNFNALVAAADQVVAAHPTYNVAFNNCHDHVSRMINIVRLRRGENPSIHALVQAYQGSAKI